MFDYRPGTEANRSRVDLQERSARAVWAGHNALLLAGSDTTNALCCVMVSDGSAAAALTAGVGDSRAAAGALLMVWSGLAG